MVIFNNVNKKNLHDVITVNFHTAVYFETGNPNCNGPLFSSSIILLIIFLTNILVNVNKMLI